MARANTSNVSAVSTAKGKLAKAKKRQSMGHKRISGEWC